MSSIYSLFFGCRDSNGNDEDVNPESDLLQPVFVSYLSLFGKEVF